jgi:hypothetical protein
MSSLKSKIQFWIFPVLPELIAMALIIVFCSRCTPVNTSVEKADFTKESGAVSPVNSLPVAQKNDLEITKRISVDSDADDRSVLVPLVGRDVRLTISAVELARFKREGRADVQLDGIPSSMSQAILSVAASNSGVTLSELSDFELTLEKNSPRNSWTIEIPSSDMSHMGVQTMLSNLDQISLVFKAPAPVSAGSIGGTGSAAPAPEVYPATE